jgi:hypothetical protein
MSYQIDFFEDLIAPETTIVTRENKFPIPPATDAQALADFADLQKFDGFSILKSGDWFSRSEFDDSFKRHIYIDSNRIGLVASDKHHWAARMACDSLVSPSPIRSWYQSKHRKSLENSKFYEKNPKTALALRKYIASQFRPTAAKAVYKLFNATNIYDPCGGWGDRMVAAMSSNIPYHCRDVNPLVLAGYASMQYMYGGNVSFEYEQSELSAPDGTYDLVFTSPPYWKVEKYQGDLSSFKKYPKFEDWLENFLFAMLDNCLSVLRPNGHMVINISDVYASHTYNRIVQPVLEYLKDKNPYVIGYRMAKRVNSKSLANGIFCEPMIVVKKT